MIKKIGLLLLLMAGVGMTTEAQLADKATFFGGFNYQFVSITPQGSPSPDRLPFYGIGGGMNYTLAHSDDQCSLGLNPNANFSFAWSNVFGISALANAPVYVLARYGSNATPYNEQKFGIGAGIGASYTYMYLRQPFIDQFGNRANFTLAQGWINPTAIVELNFKTRFSDYMFRFQWSLAQPTHEIEDLNGVGYPYSFGVAGLSIFYTF